MYLKREFARKACTDTTTFVYCMRGEAYNMSESPMASIPEMENEHLEADTAMFYVVSVLQQHSALPIVIDSEDTDVVALSAYVSTKINGVLGIKRKKGIFDCKQLCEPSMAKIIVRLHVMTGCDSVSSFYGIGKKQVWKRTATSVEAQKLLEELSDESLVKFTIRYIYNDKRSKTLAEVR